MGGPEPPPQAQAQAQAVAPHQITLRMQVLTTEHWSLLASRGLAWNESFSRAGMYLSTLSGTMVALGLIAGLDHVGSSFILFALVMLPVDLFIGLGTFLRMGAANYHDAMTVIGMNRIRAAYLELVPELRDAFVMGTHDDPSGLAVTMAVPPGTPPLLHLVAATPFLINVLNAVVAGAIAALVSGALLRLGTLAAVGLAAVIGLAVLAGQLALVQGNIRRGQARQQPQHPTT